MGTKGQIDLDEWQHGTLRKPAPSLCKTYSFPGDVHLTKNCMQKTSVAKSRKQPYLGVSLQRLGALGGNQGKHKSMLYVDLIVKIGNLVKGNGGF